MKSCSSNSASMKLDALSEQMGAHFLCPDMNLISTFMKAAVVNLCTTSRCVVFVAKLMSIAVCAFLAVFALPLPSQICESSLSKFSKQCVYARTGMKVGSCLSVVLPSIEFLALILKCGTTMYRMK